MEMCWHSMFRLYRQCSYSRMQHGGSWVLPLTGRLQGKASGTITRSFGDVLVGHMALCLNGTSQPC
jgi:hypothetical protein